MIKPGFTRNHFGLINNSKTTFLNTRSVCNSKNAQCISVIDCRCVLSGTNTCNYPVSMLYRHAYEYSVNYLFNIDDELSITWPFI